jgi:hypothetical protein
MVCANLDSTLHSTLHPCLFWRELSHERAPSFAHALLTLSQVACGVVGVHTAAIIEESLLPAGPLHTLEGGEGGGGGGGGGYIEADSVSGTLAKSSTSRCLWTWGWGFYGQLGLGTEGENTHAHTHTHIT